MPEIDPVILELRADLKQYRTDLTGAQRLTETKLAAIEARGVAMGQNIRKGFDLAKGAALGFVASLGVDAVVQAAQKGLEYASSLGEVAQQLGITTDALQEYRYAASQAGLSQEEMDQALSQLTRRIGEAVGGTKAQAEAFNKLGVSVKDANGNVIDAGITIPRIADALQKIESPAERAAILMDLFGRAGQKLEPLLSGGSAAVNELREAAHKLGVVLSEEQIQRADETADKLSAIKQVLEARIAGVVADNANAILGLANALASVADWAGRAFNAYRRFKLEQGARTYEAKSQSWFLSDKEKAEAQRTATRFRYELDRMDGKPVGFGTKGLDALLSRTPSVGSGPVGTSPSSPSKTKTSAATDSGPSSAEILARIDSQLASMAQQALSAMESVAKSADERAELELRSVELARVRALREVDTDTDLERLGEEEAANQRARIKSQIEALADAERARIEERRKAELEQDTRDLAQERYNNDRDALQVQYELADSQSERKRLALEMVDLELRYQKALLEAIIASETATEAEKERARIALEGVNATADGRQETASRANEGPLDAYRRRLNRSSDAINEEVESYVVDELNNVRDGIRGAIEKQLGVKDPLISGLLNLLIENVILKPLADALANASGGGGGGIGGALASIGTALLGGRASGGYVNGGQMYRVNEGASPGRVEGFIPQGSGHIVPLGRMNALKSGGGGRVFNITVDARNSVNPEGFEQRILAEAAKRAAQMDGQAAQATLKAMPGRMSQYQRDGF